jgi:TBC1 domain family member 15
MTIELDSTLAQAEVLFLSYAQLVADIDRRRGESASATPSVSTAGDVRRRGTARVSAAFGADPTPPPKSKFPELSQEMRNLLHAGR